MQDIPDSLHKSKRPRLADDPGGDSASIRAAWSTREADLSDVLEKAKASAAQAHQSAMGSRGEMVSTHQAVQAAREVADERDRAASQARAELSIAEASYQKAVAEEGGYTVAAAQHQSKVFQLERLEKDDADAKRLQLHIRWLKSGRAKKAAAAAAAAAASDALADASGTGAAASGLGAAAAASGGAAAAASALAAAASGAAAAASGAAATASALAANLSAPAANSSSPPRPLGGEAGAVTSWVEGATGGREAEDFRDSELVSELRRITNELTAQLGVEREWMSTPECSEALEYDYEGLAKLESLVDAFEAEVQAADEHEADAAEAGRVEEKNKKIRKVQELDSKMKKLLAQAVEQRKTSQWVAVAATNREIAPVRQQIESVRELLGLGKGDDLPELLAVSSAPSAGSSAPAPAAAAASSASPSAALVAPSAAVVAPSAAVVAPSAAPAAPSAAPAAPSVASSGAAADAMGADSSAAPAAASAAPAAGASSVRS